MNSLLFGIFRIMALLFNHLPRLKPYLRHQDGFFEFTLGFQTETASVDRAVQVSGGRMRALKKTPAKADLILYFKDDHTLLEMLTTTPNEILNLILHNKMKISGNLSYLQLFNYYVSLLAGPLHQRLLRRKQKQLRQERQADYGAAATDNRPDDRSSRQQPLKSDGEADPGARYLPEPFLADYQLKDFPRLEKMLEQHFTVKPRVCVERPRLLTRWYRDNGFELDREGRPWPPVLRQAGAFKYL
ncbi:MAG: formate acetyltransferase, partial [Desulfosudaceae bacterium]